LTRESNRGMYTYPHSLLIEELDRSESLKSPITTGPVGPASFALRGLVGMGGP